MRGGVAAQAEGGAVREAGRRVVLRGPQVGLRARAADPGRERVLVHPCAQQQFLVGEGGVAVGDGWAGRAGRHQRGDRRAADRAVGLEARADREDGVRHRVVDALDVAPARGPAGSEGGHRAREHLRGVAAVVRAALPAQQQRVVARQGGPARVGAVRRPAPGARQGLGARGMGRAPGRVVVETAQLPPVAVGGRRGRLRQQHHRQQPGRRERRPAVAQRPPGRARQDQPAAEQHVPRRRHQRAPARPQRGGRQDARPRRQRRQPRQARRQPGPGGDHGDPGQDEGLPVRASVRRREQVPGQVCRRPLERERHGHHQPRPPQPGARRRRPVEGQRGHQQQRPGAHEDGGGGEGVRPRQQPREEVGPGHRPELLDPPRVGPSGAEEQRHQDRRREPDPQQGAPGRPRDHRQTAPDALAGQRHPSHQHQRRTQRRHVGGVEVGGPADGDDQRREHRPPPAQGPFAGQAQQGEGDQPVQPHRVVGSLDHRPAAQRVRGPEQPGRPPRPAPLRAQQPGHRRRRDRRLEHGDDVHREVDVLAREEPDEDGERAGQVGAQVRQEAGAVAGLPVEQQSAPRTAVQEVPQVRVEGDELVAEVVDAAVARSVREDPGGGVPGAHGHRREQRGERRAEQAGAARRCTARRVACQVRRVARCRHSGQTLAPPGDRRVASGWPTADPVRAGRVRSARESLAEQVVRITMTA